MSHVNEERLEQIWHKCKCTPDRDSIQGEKLTEAAEPGEHRKERNEEGIASVKPPCAP